MSKLRLVLAALALAGCTVEGVHETGPHDVRPVAPSQVEGAFAQAGTAFHVTIDGPIGTQVSHEGDSFSATVDDPILDHDGHVLVPKGAKLHGTIADIERGTAPKLMLDFKTIESEGGALVPIDARIRELQRMTYPGEPLYSPYPAGPFEVAYDPAYGYDTVFTPFPDYAMSVYSREIMIPAGSAMTLQLTRPLLAPGTRIVRPPPTPDE